jgi:hypothetical protein
MYRDFKEIVRDLKVSDLGAGENCEKYGNEVPLHPRLPRFPRNSTITTTILSAFFSFLSQLLPPSSSL